MSCNPYSNKWLAVSAGVVMFSLSLSVEASTMNYVSNGSFEGQIGVLPSGWSLGGAIYDGYPPVTIPYNAPGVNYPFGAQGEAVPTDNAISLSPDATGAQGVYFVTDEAKNLSLYQYVTLTPGSYDIGFDSYDTFNGNAQPHDATLTASIAGTQVANFSLSSVGPGSWSTHEGVALIETAGQYLVSFTFNTPDTPDNPLPNNPGDIYDAKDVVIDRAYVIAYPNGGGIAIPPVLTGPTTVSEPASLTLLAGAISGLITRRHRRRGRPR